jgi:hypothetical protein
MNLAANFSAEVTVDCYFCKLSFCLFIELADLWVVQFAAIPPCRFSLCCCFSQLPPLTLNLLMSTIVAPPCSANKWQMGFNSAFKGLTWFSICVFDHPCSGVLLEKLTISQLVKNFSSSYGALKFIGVFTTAHHLSQS